MSVPHLGHRISKDMKRAMELPNLALIEECRPELLGISKNEAFSLAGEMSKLQHEYKLRDYAEEVIAASAIVRGYTVSRNLAFASAYAASVLAKLGVPTAGGM